MGPEVSLPRLFKNRPSNVYPYYLHKLRPMISGLGMHALCIRLCIRKYKKAVPLQRSNFFPALYEQAQISEDGGVHSGWVLKKVRRGGVG